MKRSISHIIFVGSITLGGLGALTGLSVGFWCLLQDTSAGSYAMKAGIVLVSILVVSGISGLLLARSLSKPLKFVHDIITGIFSGKTSKTPENTGPQEISQIIDSLVKLSDKLEHDKKESEVLCREHAREMRTESLIRLSRGFAREVQNSLAGLIGFAEMALKQADLDGQVKNYLTLIDQEARSGRQSLERILTYIQTDDFPTEPVELNRLLVEASQTVSSSKGENIRLKMNLADDLPRIMGDPGRLSQVLNVLIQNAKEAIGHEGEVELNSTTDQSGNVVIMIKDTGCGIPEELQEKVFTPFFTTKGNIRGAGLSLAVADSIVRSHGGKLEFFSKENEGTTFFMKIPMEKS